MLRATQAAGRLFEVRHPELPTLGIGAAPPLALGGTALPLLLGLLDLPLVRVACLRLPLLLYRHLRLGLSRARLPGNRSLLRIRRGRCGALGLLGR